MLISNAGAPRPSFLSSQSSSGRANRRNTTCALRNGSQGVLVRFNIAYKTNFGQQLRLVGNTDSLGQWDIERSVPMQWTQGDIWTADVSLPANMSTEVEYKYVVCNENDMSAAAWKPGGNFALSVPKAGDGSMRVRDAWDNTFREVQIEVVRDGGKAKRRSSKKDEDDEYAVEAISRATDKALVQLDAAISMSLDLMRHASDPACVELLAADRMVAAASHRAMTMSKALDAASAPMQPTTSSKNPTKKS